MAWGFPARKVLGVLMLDTRFVRLPGDIGHPATFSGAVRYAVVAGASPKRVVREHDPALLAPFIDAARHLVDEHAASAITTSCGFLVLWQQALQDALPVPVWTSSLLLLPDLPRAGVVTVDAAALGPEHLRAAGARAATPVEGLAPGCALQRTLLEDRAAELDVEDARQQVVDAALRLLARDPALTDIVLECANMPPYAEAVRRATGRRVHDITTLLAAQGFATSPLHAGARP